ncbi:50S ribosomal protein L2 [Candidatus Pacearchaeota archaeon]|nr:50S ribosomal protein L2 [Candidatus Pacearchaeota archaeon]|tara:strand:+ start:486 stop:1208 length:723 start_codon:yes stop_codon:yes gene_type:complete
MGKRITQQARGRGGPTFKVRKIAFRHEIKYPNLKVKGEGKISKLIHSPGHSAPLAEIKIDNSKFIVPAASGIYEGQEVWIGKRPENKDPESGDVLALVDINQGTKVFNVENSPGDGGKILRTAGSSGIVMNKDDKKVEVLIRRRSLKVNKDARAVVGVVAGEGRKMKPYVKAGKKHHIMKAVGRKWHRTSAVKVNAIDHPFGGGRGKRIKSKIAKRNSPPGLKVGHIRPSKTGRKKTRRR